MWLVSFPSRTIRGNTKGSKATEPLKNDTGPLFHCCGLFMADSMLCIL